MKNLSTLAQNLEQNAKVQRERTDAMLKAAFSEHEQSVKQELNESVKRINSAINDHNEAMNTAIQLNKKKMLKKVGQTWLFIAVVSFLLICTSGGILKWQSQQIRDNYQVISEQNDALTKLNARTWGVTYQEDNQGRFLVLPAGMKADTNWTFDDGQKNGIRLVQE